MVNDPLIPRMKDCACPYVILRPSLAEVPVILHIPHSSTFIPTAIRKDIILDDEELQQELACSTDWHMDELSNWALEIGAIMFINSYSRLVFDPERFSDDADEPMAAVGRGFCYTKTLDGRAMRSADAKIKSGIKKKFFNPYAVGMETLVAKTLEKFNRCLILDCHSFSSNPSSHMTDEIFAAPDICIGTDAFHTPREMPELLAENFQRNGYLVSFNSPFSGCYVPLSKYRTDNRVKSLMVEVKRSLYSDAATGIKNSSFEEVKRVFEIAALDVLRSF